MVLQEIVRESFVQSIKLRLVLQRHTKQLLGRSRGGQSPSKKCPSDQFRKRLNSSIVVQKTVEKIMALQADQAEILPEKKIF